jgi:hypothetical protein
MFGDVHEENLGKERAFFLSPMKTAAQKGLVVTNHTDYFSSPPSPLFAVWTAVNRLSRSNVVIGPDERVTPYEALRAMTANGAYMYFEEKSKGSLEVGKLADLVILDQNPLTVDRKTIKDIKVLETIKEGATVYRRDDAKKAELPSSCADSDVCFKMASDVLGEAGVIDMHAHAD